MKKEIQNKFFVYYDVLKMDGDYYSICVSYLFDTYLLNIDYVLYYGFGIRDEL